MMNVRHKRVQFVCFCSLPFKTSVTPGCGVFLKEEKDCTYEAYSHFDWIRKDSSFTMEVYITDFEQNWMKKCNMTLPEAV